MSIVKSENFFNDIYCKPLIEKPETQKITIKAPKNLLAEFSNEGLKITTSKEKKQVPMPKKYIINKGATVLIWDDGEKTVVKRCADDEFNKRLGFLTAFFQHYSGMSKNKANKFLAELEVEDEEIEIKETKKPKHMKGEK